MVKSEQVRVYRVVEKGDELLEEANPTMNGKPLDYIPFQFINADTITPVVSDPPLLDLIDENMAHYRTDADYKHGLHFTGLPTPVVTGYTTSPNEKLTIGSAEAWTIPDPAAKAYFLEFEGKGLSEIVTALESMEKHMGILGARLLLTEKKATETAETARIHRTGENSVLAAVANMLSMGLTNSMQTFALWAGTSDDTSIVLNKDFSAIIMDAKKLTALVAARVAGEISQETFFYNLKIGEMYSDTTDFEEERTRIEQEGPPAPPPVE